MCIPHPGACHPVALARGSTSCLMHRLPLSVLPLPVRSVLCVLWRCIDVFLPGVPFAHPVGRPPPSFSLCVGALSCGFPSLLCVFSLLSSLHARSNPIARAHWILINLGTVSCVLHGSLPSCPLVFWLFDAYWTLWGHFVLAPPPFPIPLPASYVYTPLCRLPPCGACPRFHVLPHAPIAPIRSPAACSLSAVSPLAVY